MTRLSTSEFILYNTLSQMSHHVLYGGAHLWSPNAAAKLAGIAQKSFEAHAGPGFAALCGGSSANEADLIERVRTKLASSPIESMCVDFEDGYGVRSVEEEDRDAERIELADPITGIRVKRDRVRARRTLERFAGKLGTRTVTFPKVESVDEVKWLISTLDELGMKDVGVELMIETPRALVDASGRVAIASFVEAAGGRCRAVHLGAYDLCASAGIIEQRLDHPLCDTARTLMVITLAGTDIRIYDGATTTLPLGADPRAAWKLHASNVRHALSSGIYAGWDLHPAQLPARWGALIAFFLEHREGVMARLRAFQDRASRIGEQFDDAATIRGLELFVQRGIAVGFPAVEHA